MRYSKNTKYVAAILALVILALAIVKLYILPIFQYPHVPVSQEISATCFTVRRALEVYCEQKNVNPLEISVVDFVGFLSEEVDSVFGEEAPVAPFESKRDVAFYLLSPAVASSKGRLVVYSSDFQEESGGAHRCVFLLRDSELLAEKWTEVELSTIVGEAVVRQEKADFYYWHLRPLYLKDSKAVESDK
jgi:hypothetical protein